ncbi:MAG: hypothetical protein M0D54_08985 [Hyphomonadaceae bacterium JAD_PAG50586_4]|nr:MAG: hypothetical protein M0D54_08985 [Hyphomonadaceae bacterium JAD_PAG50586_4]
MNRAPGGGVELEVFLRLAPTLSPHDGRLRVHEMGRTRKTDPNYSQETLNRLTTR